MMNNNNNNNNNFMALNTSKNNHPAAMFMNKKKKTTQGRKKIEIKKIDNVSSRQVTFSKRRTGIFHKASEICILTGAEAAIIVQSSGKRLYTFGHPSVEAVIDRYTTGRPSPCSASSMIGAAEMREFNLEYNRLCDELEAEKKKLEIEENAKLAMMNNGNSFWWDEPVDHLGVAELEQYVAALEELRKNLLTKADELALLKNSHALGININVDLNIRTNHQYCTTTTTTSSSSINHVPCASSHGDNYHHFGNQ